MEGAPNEPPAQPPQPGDQPPAEAPRPTSDNRLADHLANERTLLAWNRTGIAIIALGFVVARFGLLLRELAGIRASSYVPTASGFIGLLLTLFGAVITALSLVRYLRIERSIERGQPEVETGLGIALAAGLTLTGLALAGYLAFAR
jgi:inner membrane protein YidH